MDIEELQTFVEVADGGGISPAARRLGVSKSIVSRRLFRLESELGVQLTEMLIECFGQGPSDAEPA